MRIKAALIVAVAIATTLGSAAEAAPRPSPVTVLTNRHLDRVPLNIHFGKRNGDLTDAEIDFLATNSVLVTLEKGRGARAHGSTEAGVADTTRRLKQRNPSVKVLFYLNAFINWSGYEAFKTYRPEWTLRTADGEIVKHTSGTPRPNPSNAVFREWWSDVIANEMMRGRMDGVFVDALPQALTPALTKAVGSEKARTVASLTAAEPSKPNIVVIVADDMGWGDSRTFSNELIQTPNMDRLRAEGVKLTQCYSACGVCSPSRSAILTGRTPYRNGVYRHLSGNH